MSGRVRISYRDALRQGLRVADDLPYLLQARPGPPNQAVADPQAVLAARLQWEFKPG